MGVNLDTVKKFHQTNESIDDIHDEILFHRRIIFDKYNGRFMIVHRFLFIICMVIASYTGYKCSDTLFVEKCNVFVSIFIFTVVIVLVAITLAAALKYIEEAALKFYASNIVLHIYEHCVEMAKRYSADQEEQTDLATYYFTLYDIPDANIDNARAELGKIIHN
jgi:hypothetical protein